MKAGRIVSGEPYVVRDVPLYGRLEQGARTALIATNDLVSIDVRNCPYDMSEGKEIRKAYCSVAVFHQNGDKLLEFDYPRWEDNPKPGYQGNPSDHFPPEWNFRDLHPNGSRNRIDFVIKPHGDERAYGFRGRSQRTEKWCDKELAIPPGQYCIQIVVRGGGISEPSETWVSLRCAAGEERISVNRISKPSWA
jgi:hypothetical protein